MTDQSDLIEKRRKLLIPATFGIHSMIHERLREYVTRKFQHSTFSFHEVFLDHPATWWQKPEDQNGALNGTTQPFLSRFVYQSGLTPQVNRTTIGTFKNRVAQGDPIFDPLEIPLVATSRPDYHRGLEEMVFPLKDSIVLRGLRQIWLDVAADPNFRLENWKGIEGWSAMFTDVNNSVKVGLPSPRSNRAVSVIGQLNGPAIKEWYREKVRNHLNIAIQQEALARNSANATQEECQVSKAKVDAADNAALALLREYQIALRPWIDADQGAPVFVAVSISSDALFWGECVVLLPSVGSMSEEDYKDYDGVVDILAANVKSTFMPIMTIFETYWLEHELREQCHKWRDSKDWEKLQGTPQPFTFPSDYFPNINPNWGDKANVRALELVGMGHRPNESGVGDLKKEQLALSWTPNDDRDHIFLSMLYHCLGKPHWKAKLNELEQSLVSLWSARFSVVFYNLPKDGRELGKLAIAMKKIEDSLVFEKYLISSPAILKAIMTAIGLRHGDRGKGKASIKTALVVGGPGSGKDSMAKLVRLFSPGYRFGELITLNMASFRPKEAAVPLLLGLDIFDNSKASTAKSFSIASLLGRAWKSNRQNDSDPPFRYGKGLAFIFDELNSLDMDTQGALLRFLESGELLALGDFKDKIENIDALIIGVMNEDPNSITKARTLDRVLRDKQVFGGMLGDYLYELFRGQRRLRDDLYFRMARGGEIVLPELRDRREDIPILFYFILTKELMETLDDREKENFDIELSTYDQLMDRAVEWEGNVRELQRLTREIFRLAYDDFNGRQRRGEEGVCLTFRGNHVHTARQNLMRTPESSSDELVPSM